MLRILANPKRLCDGMTRRDLLQVGGLTFGGLGLSQLLDRQASASPEVDAQIAASFGKAKQCLVLFLYGSPSQLETFDMKPEAPLEVRGSIGSIASSLPGLDVAELLPEMAKIMDRTTVIRSCTHDYPLHGVAHAMTGVPTIDVAMELNPRDERHQPYFGSCVEHFDRQRRGGGPAEFLQNVALPFPFSSKRSDQPFRAGPYAAYLGASFDPVWTEFVGEGTKVIRKERDGGFSFEGPEPYLGTTKDSHFRLAAVEPLPNLTLDRLKRRRSLVDQFDQSRRDLEQTRAGETMTSFQQMAYSLVGSPQVRDALDTRLEPEPIRELYGHTLFGQSCLTARRLLEAGTRLVSVFWDEYGLAGDAWDTHFDHFPRMIDQLCPGLDKAYSGLILDLEQRGMLDETLVLLVSEHGRSPRINGAKGGGRDHWARAYSTVMAGGGIARGNVVGATDEVAGEVADRPVSPKSILKTMYHLLGIDPHQTIPDFGGRPIPLVPHEAEIIHELLA